MGLDRRTFLQRAGLGLLTLGISQTGLSFLTINSRIKSKINRYYQTLAAPTPRKLALLVGINEYVEGEPLKGCITDVELQQELLIHRFGFQPEDIVILTGRQATREGIENAFLEHLTQQVQSSDVVVFHFSGYGTQVKIPSITQQEIVDNPSDFRLVNSFVPSDGILPTQKNPVMNDLLLETLLLLGRTLPTDKLTLVLDTSHYSTGKFLQGNLRIRSLPSNSQNPNPEELVFQEQLKQKVSELEGNNKLSQKDIAQRSALFPGVIFSAAKNNSYAAEVQGNNWSAGLLTYALTQYLWQVTPASKVIIALSKTTKQVEEIVGSGQIPTLKGRDNLNSLTYFLMPESLIGAEGVLTKITQVDNKNTTAQVKLTGLPPTVVDYYGLYSRFKLVSPSKLQQPTQTTKDIIVQLSAREGLTATVQPLDKTNNAEFPFQIGQQIQEWLRVLPRHINLVVALDQSLEKIERVDATSAFSGIGIISPVINVGESFADCLFAKVDRSKQTIASDNSQKPTTTEPAPSSDTGYGLLWTGGSIIPNSVGKANEAVKSAIQRLTPQLKSLLGAKLWRLTINEGSSWLGVSATLEKIAQKPQPLIHRLTRRVAVMTCGDSNATNYLSKLSSCPQELSPTIISEPSSTQSQEPEGLPKLSIGTPIQFRLQNYSELPIYYLLFALDASGSVISLYSPQLAPQSTTPQENLGQLKQPVIEPSKTVILPQPSSDLYWRVSRPKGLVEVFLVCSAAPFEKTLNTLADKHSFSGEQEQILTLPNPLESAQALLQDLHTLSTVKMNVNGTSSDSYAMDVNLWATLSFMYQVVE